MYGMDVEFSTVVLAAFVVFVFVAWALEFVFEG